MDYIKAKKDFSKTLISIAVPIALQNLMLALVGASDALMLGRLSQNAVSAVSLANQVSFIMTIFVGSIVGGVGTLVAQYYGKKDNDTVKRLMSIGIKLCAATSIIFFLITFFMPDVLMRIYTTDTELIVTGSEYLKIVSFSYLMSGVTQIYLMIMKITDRAATSAVISIMTVVIDMSVDFFLIYGIAGFPRMEVKGCAVSTVVVEACALLVCGVFPAGGDTAYDAKTVFISMWCVSLPLAFLGSFVFHFSPMIVFILVMCDEIIKIPWIFPRYKKYIWLKNLTHD